MHNGEADERWERQLRAMGLAVAGLQNCTHIGRGSGPTVIELKFKLEQDNRTSVLVIVKARGEEGGLVGFVGALDLETAMIAVEGKLRAGSMKWREDRPWSEREGGKS